MQIQLVIYLLLVSSLFSFEKKIIDLVDGDRIIGEVIASSDVVLKVKTNYGTLDIPKEKILLIKNFEADKFDSSLSFRKAYNQEARWRTIWAGMSITNSLYGWGIPYVLGIEESQFTFGMQFLLIGGSFYAGYNYTQEMDLPLGRYQLQTNGAKLASLSLIPIISMIGWDKWWEFDEDAKISLMYCMAAIPYGVIKADEYYQTYKLSNGHASMISHGTNLGLLNSYLLLSLLHPEGEVLTENYRRLYSTIIFSSALAGGYYAHQYVSGEEYSEDDAKYISTSGILGLFNSSMLLSIIEPEETKPIIFTLMLGVNAYTYIADKINEQYNLRKGQSLIVNLGTVASVFGWWGIATIFDIDDDKIWASGNMISSTLGWYMTHSWVSQSSKENIFGSAKIVINPTIMVDQDRLFPGFNFQASF